MKRIAAVILSLILLVSVAMPFTASAKNEQSSSPNSSGGYPFIFVHGMAAWGSYENFYKLMPYWGGWGFHRESDIIKIFNRNGIEAYAASVGPFSSAWDRACELYAQLTGTVVDYGEAHSKAHNHDRYGFSYVGRQLMDECWDVESKLNLIGHSFGAPTVRLFTSLLAYGDEAELAATGDDTSELFKGGHDCINSVVSLAGVNNGTPFASTDSVFRMALGFNVAGALFGNNLMMWSFQLGHFGLTPKQGQFRACLSLKNVMNFAKSNDNCYADMTLDGAADLNEKARTVPTTYYYSYSARATVTDENDDEVPIDSMFRLFRSSSTRLGKVAGQTFDGRTLDKNWEINDGLVPYASAIYPMTDAATALSYEQAVTNNDPIEPGRWYYTALMEGFDHFDFCGTRDYPTSFEDFYFSLAKMVNENG